VLAYLARYTHRVAIANSRLVSLDERAVRIRWKDYRTADPATGAAPIKTMSLSPAEFLRRFLLHVLPTGFHRIRHYGLLAKGPRARPARRPRSRTGGAGARSATRLPLLRRADAHRRDRLARPHAAHRRRRPALDRQLMSRAWPTPLRRPRRGPSAAAPARLRPSSPRSRKPADPEPSRPAPLAASRPRTPPASAAGRRHCSGAHTAATGARRNAHSRASPDRRPGG
jgi:hypothetical protein